MKRLKGVLLDIDGTLLDSNDAHAQSWVDALSASGVKREFQEVRSLIGMGSDHLLPRLGIDPESERGKTIAKLRAQVFREHYLPNLKPFPGTRGLLERMQSDGLTLVVATSAGRDEVQPLLQAAGIADLVDAKTSADDAEESKPAPDIVEAAVKRSGAEHDQLLMLGDTPYDVESARSAGVAVVALRSGGWDDAALHGALAVYADTADLLAHYEHSPLAAAIRRTSDSCGPHA
jgi:HAD superfamily hydrolase (TIGR01509 family)